MDSPPRNYTDISDEELRRRFGPVDDPVIEARRQRILRVLLEVSPDIRQELFDEPRPPRRRLRTEVDPARGAPW